MDVFEREDEYELKAAVSIIIMVILLIVSLGFCIVEISKATPLVKDMIIHEDNDNRRDTK